MMIAAIHQVHQTGWKKKNENKDAWSTSWINQGPPSPSSSIKDRCPHSQFLKSLFFSAAVFVLVFASLRQSTSEKQKQKKDQSDLDLDWICFSSLFQWGVGYSDKSNRAIFFSPSLYTHDGQKGAWFSVNQSLVKEKQKVKQKRPSCFLSSPNRLCYILYTMYNSINPPHRVFIYTVYRT